MSENRKRLTVTAMIKAIEELDLVLSDGEATAREWCSVTLSLAQNDDKVTTYVVHFQDYPRIESTNNFEEALAMLLDYQRQRVEKRREELLASVNGVLSKHHGALKGVRSKLRDAKMRVEVTK